MHRVDHKADGHEGDQYVNYNTVEVKSVVLPNFCCVYPAYTLNIT